MSDSAFRVYAALIELNGPGEPAPIGLADVAEKSGGRPIPLVLTLIHELERLGVIPTANFSGDAVSVDVRILPWSLSDEGRGDE
jgi:hypothetical protein